MSDDDYDPESAMELDAHGHYCLPEGEIDEADMYCAEHCPFRDRCRENAEKSKRNPDEPQ